MRCIYLLHLLFCHLLKLGSQPRNFIGMVHLRHTVVGGLNLFPRGASHAISPSAWIVSCSSTSSHTNPRPARAAMTGSLPAVLRACELGADASELAARLPDDSPVGQF